MYKKVMATYGPKGILIREANGSLLTREEWYEKMGHTDGLKLAVIREMNILSNPGGGVVGHKPGKDIHYR
jgi:hypothetical protein